MKKSILLFSAVCLFILGSNTKTFAQQSNQTEIGIRFGGYENGLDLKYFTNSSTALEGILGFRPGVVVLTGLYEKQQMAFSEPSLSWYYGVGAHIGGVGRDVYYDRYTGNKYYYANNGLLLGADAILGLEWKIPNIPFSLSGDLHPRLELARGPYLDLEPGISIRFVF